MMSVSMDAIVLRCKTCNSVLKPVTPNPSLLSAYKCVPCQDITFQCLYCTDHDKCKPFKRYDRALLHLKQQLPQHASLPVLKPCSKCEVYNSYTIPNITLSPTILIHQCGNNTCAQLTYQCGLCTDKVILRGQKRNLEQHQRTTHTTIALTQPEEFEQNANDDYSVASPEMCNTHATTNTSTVPTVYTPNLLPPTLPPLE